MASRRILNRLSNSSFLYFSGIILLISIFISSCGTTRKSSTDAESGDTTTETVSTDEAADEVSGEFIALLNTNRSSLEDVYSTQKSDMPNIFLKKSSDRDIGDPNQGYRIQILSTRDVTEADSIASGFRFWAVENLKEYVPEAYVLYRQPYYKVHVGNFQFQDQATQLNTFIKKRYPDAWVVPDEVEPDLVPPDTLMFGEENDKVK